MGQLSRNTQHTGWKEVAVPALVTCSGHTTGKRLAKRFADTARKAGLTQESLAERADMHHNLIGEVERVGAGSVEHNCRLAIDNSQQSLIANGVRVRREGRCRARGDAEGEPQLEG